MQLTPKQEEEIRNFLKISSITVRHLSKEAKEQVLKQLRQGLRREIKAAFQNENLPDDWLQKIFVRLKVSENGWLESGELPVEKVRHEAQQINPKVVDEESELDSLLLGVCDFWAERWNLDTLYVRIFMCVLGALTGPVAILVYLGGYAEWRHKVGQPRLDWRNVLHSSAITFLLCILIFSLGKVSLLSMRLIYEGFYQKPLLLSEWGLLESDSGLFAVGAIILLVPLTALGSLPVKREWKGRINTSVQIGLIGYGVIIALEISYALTGFLLRVSERFSF